MNHFTNRHYLIKRYARLLLVMFVVSAMNMSVQLPSHAAMQQMMASAQTGSYQMPGMAQKSLRDCECLPAMCEVVASLSDQNIESLFSISFNHLLGFQPTYSSHIEDVHHRPSVILLNHHERQYRQFALPPLSLSTILHI